MRSFLENHVEALLAAQDRLDELANTVKTVEQGQTKVKNGEHALAIPAQFGQYPVFDGMVETGQKVHIAMAYADAKTPGTHFEERRTSTGTAFEIAHENTSPDKAVHVRFIFPEPEGQRSPGLRRSPQVVFEDPLYTRAGAQPWEQNRHPVASDFAIFLKASSYGRSSSLGAYPGDIDPVDRVMNTDFYSGAELVFHMPNGGANRPENKRAKYASDIVRLFFVAKGYSPEPVDIAACVQAWHSDQKELLSVTKSDFERASAEHQRLNTQRFTSVELAYLSKLIRVLKDIASDYKKLKDTLGDNMVLDPIAKIARPISKKAPSNRFDTLTSIAYGMRQALDRDDQSAFAQKFQAVVTLLSNLEKSIQGEGSSSSSDWPQIAEGIKSL